MYGRMVIQYRYIVGGSDRSPKAYIVVQRLKGYSDALEDTGKRPKIRTRKEGGWENVARECDRCKIRILLFPFARTMGNQI